MRGKRKRRERKYRESEQRRYDIPFSYPSSRRQLPCALCPVPCSCRLQAGVTWSENPRLALAAATYLDAKDPLLCCSIHPVHCTDA